MTDAPKPLGPKMYGYEVIETFDHDPNAYTQGLLIVDGELYESTGRLGESTVRHVDLKTGDIKRRRDVASDLFGEGLAASGDFLYQLTWHKHMVLVYHREKLRRMSYTYTYPGDGWGLTTNDDGEFVMSDGTDAIRFIEPKDFVEKRRIRVTDRGRALTQINELEWINGEIWANVWKQDLIARIDPDTGEVTGWIDMRGILGDYRVARPEEDVLNGIAYDASNGNIYVTGKMWPHLFQIKVVEK